MQSVAKVLLKRRQQMYSINSYLESVMNEQKAVLSQYQHEFLLIIYIFRLNSGPLAAAVKQNIVVIHLRLLNALLEYVKCCGY